MIDSNKAHPLVVLHIGSKRTCASDVTCNVASVPASPCTNTVVPNEMTIQHVSQYKAKQHTVILLKQVDCFFGDAENSCHWRERSTFLHAV